MVEIRIGQLSERSGNMSVVRAALIFLPAAIGFVAGCLGVLCIAGAVTSAVEDEYWSDFWQDTPSTDNILAENEIAIETNQVNGRSDSSLKKAA